MSSKSKTVLRYGLAGLVLGAVFGLYAANRTDTDTEPLMRKLDVKKSAQLGLALLDFVKKASAL